MENLDKLRHPVPEKYHRLLYIGEHDRRGNRIDFKVPPVIIDSSKSLDDWRSTIFNEHLDIGLLPMTYVDAKPFLILRPTALAYRTLLRERLLESGFLIQEEFELHNFMRFADIVYELDPGTSFHWKWRIIMRSFHDTGIQEQNKAAVFVFKEEDMEMSCEKVMDFKKEVRTDMGEIPVIIRFNNNPEIALGIHHLHSPDIQRVGIEYNALMHAKNRTSIFVT